MSDILLKRVVYNKETEEEEQVAFNLNTKDISSLYRDKNGVYIVNNQGYMNKIPYTLTQIKKALEL